MTNLKPSVFGNEMLADPFPFYRRLRETHPVFRVVDLWFVAAGLTLTLSGCSGSVYQPLEIRSVGLIPNAKIEKNLRGTANGKSLAFEGGGTWMYGTDSQELNVQPFLATSAKVGNTTFVPPQTLETRFNFSVYDSSLRWRHFIAGGPFGYELAGGGGFSRLHFGATGNGMQGEETVYSPDLDVRIGVLLRLGRTTRIEANSTLFYTNSNLSSVSRNQAGLVQMLGHHVSVEGGYSWWYVESPSTTRSSVKIQASGPSLGVRFGF